MRPLSLTLSLVLASLLGTAWAWSERAVGAAAKRTTAAENVPVPHRVHARSGPLARAKSKLVELETAPFPYQGEVPRTQGSAIGPFLQFNAFARMRAVVVLPTPRAPANR